MDRGTEGTGLERELLDQLEQLGLVVGARVDRNDRLDPECPHVLDVLGEVRHPGLDLGRHLRHLRLLAPITATMVAQSPHGRNDDDNVRLEPADAADDVHELLHPEIGGEAGLGDHELTELQRHPVGDDRVVAVRDVREGAGVHEADLALERLDDVRLDRILQQDGHRTCGLDVLGRDRVARRRIADGDRAEFAAQVGEVGRQGEDRHHLACGRDVEAGLRRRSVLRATETADDAAELTVGNVDRAPPRDGCDLRLMAVEAVRVDERREQVVRGGDRVHVAREVKVDVLHRHHLGVAATGRAALDAEDRAE